MNAVTKTRPRGVTVAVALLCTMAILGSISGVFFLGRSQLERSLSQQLPYMQIIQYSGLVVGLALNLFFALMIFLGHNWARIIVLAFFVVGLLFALPSYLGVFHIVPLRTEIFGIISYLVQLVALTLLFTGNRSLWFKRNMA